MGNLPPGFLTSYKVALANLAVAVGAVGAVPDDIVVLQMTAGSVRVETSTAFYRDQTAQAFVHHLQCCGVCVPCLPLPLPCSPRFPPHGSR